MQRLLHNHVAMLVWRIGVLYVVLMCCRVIFWFYNRELFGTITWNEFVPLFSGALKFDTVSIIYANGLFILLSLIPLHLREKRWWRSMLFYYYVIINSLLIVAINLSDAVYFRYTQKRFTADEIFFADNDNSLQLIGKFMVDNWGLVVAAIVLTALLWIGYGRRVREESPLSGWFYYGVNTILFGVGAALCVAGMRGGVTRMTRPITLSNAMLYTSESSRANLILSNPFCILRTIGDSTSVKYQKYFTPEQLPTYFTPKHQPADSVQVNLKGRNVMVFIMESMSAEHSAQLHPELYADKPIKGFTPFLDSLMRNGLCFNQMYANGTRSIQALPAILGSIPSFKTPFVLMPQSLGESRQLPAILAEMGYSTAFYCGSEHGSMGFGAYARSAGVERLVSREEYEARHGKGDFDGYWGIWDEPFLQFLGEELATTRQPFFASLFTLSSHHPFLVPEKYATTLPEGYTKIHKGVAYDDLAFRHFFDRFGNDEWFRQTIFVFVADHVSSEKMAPETHEYPGNCHIIGFIYTPDGALRGTINHVTQQLDIMPTLLGLLGNNRPYFAFGRDLFNEPQRPSWSVSYSGGFRAVTDSLLLTLEENRATSTLRTNTSSENHEEALQEQLKALVQQYYSHVEQKNYTIHD